MFSSWTTGPALLYILLKFIDWFELVSKVIDVAHGLLGILSMYRSKCYSYYFVEMRQRGRLAGFSIYLSTMGVINDSFVCYKDGPLLPSLNFTTDCIGSGRFVIFFNERLSEASYPEGYETTSVTTELCEVIVQGTFLQP